MLLDLAYGTVCQPSCESRESDITLLQFRRAVKTHLSGSCQLQCRATVFFVCCAQICLFTYLRRASHVFDWYKTYTVCSHWTTKINVCTKTKAWPLPANTTMQLQKADSSGADSLQYRFMHVLRNDCVFDLQPQLARTRYGRPTQLQEKKLVTMTASPYHVQLQQPHNALLMYCVLESLKRCIQHISLTKPVFMQSCSTCNPLHSAEILPPCLKITSVFISYGTYHYFSLAISLLDATASSRLLFSLYLDDHTGRTTLNIVQLSGTKRCATLGSQLVTPTSTSQSTAGTWPVTTQHLNHAAVYSHVLITPRRN